MTTPPDIRTFVVKYRDKDGKEQQTVTAILAEVQHIERAIEREGGTVLRIYECR